MNLVLFVVALAVIAVDGPQLWQHPRLFAILLALAVVARFLKIEVQQDLPIDGLPLAIFMAAVVLSPADAAIIGVLTVAAGELYYPLVEYAKRLQRCYEGRPVTLLRHRLLLRLLEPLAHFHSGPEPSGELRITSLRSVAATRARAALRWPMSIGKPRRVALRAWRWLAAPFKEPVPAGSNTDKPVQLGISYDLADKVLYALIPGLLFHHFIGVWHLNYQDHWYYLAFLAAFALVLFMNFLFMETMDTWIDRYLFGSSAKMLTFLIPADLVTAALGMAVVYGYYASGSRASALALMAAGLAVILFVYWRAQYSKVTKKRLEFERLTGKVSKLAQLHAATGTHSAAVAHYIYVLADAAGLPFKQQVLGYRAGLVHDVGKIDWDLPLLDGTVKRPSDEQWQYMKKHPETGAEWLEEIEEREIAEIVLYHHINKDGKYGYPEGLDHDRMPEITKIMHVVDTFDCLTARDTYKDPIPPEEAFAELRRCSSLCPVSERTEDYRGREWSEQFDAEYVLEFENAWYSHPELGYNHDERQEFDDALDFYKNGLRRKRPEPGEAEERGARERPPRERPAPETRVPGVAWQQSQGGVAQATAHDDQPGAGKGQKKKGRWAA